MSVWGRGFLVRDKTCTEMSRLVQREETQAFFALYLGGSLWQTHLAVF